jgi:hypothetical protein
MLATVAIPIMPRYTQKWVEVIVVGLRDLRAVDGVPIQMPFLSFTVDGGNDNDHLASSSSSAHSQPLTPRSPLGVSNSNTFRGFGGGSAPGGGLGEVMQFRTQKSNRLGKCWCW